MNKIVKISLWTLFTLGILVLLGFVDARYEDIECNKLEVQISDADEHSFVTEEKVKFLLSDIGYHFNHQAIGAIELDRIENEILQLPGVKSVEAYKYNDGLVKLDIAQQNPIARIILQGGLMGCYLDAEGDIIPLSADYVAKVPLFSGEIHEPYNDIPSVKEATQSDSVSHLHIIDEIFAVANALNKDEFLKSQIVQVYVNAKQEFELIPRVGNHRVLLGNIDNIDNKLKYLSAFYTSKNIDVKELNLYDTLNLKYKDQIVCSTR